MEIPEPLTEAALEAELQGLDGWTVEDGKLHKEYVFRDFGAGLRLHVVGRSHCRAQGSSP